MKAMILAAGLGTRLRPLTNDLPKALVALNGRPLLQLIIENLVRNGITEIIINVHHRAQKILDFLDKNDRFNIRIAVSEESEILETGGGIKKARWFFDKDQPFLVHNVDVLTDLRLSDMYRWHKKHNALITLAVRKRSTPRQLLFDKQGQLAGWHSGNETVLNTSVRGETEKLAFMGIHIISPRIFDLFPDKVHFSIIPAYLELAQAGEKINAYRGDKAFWYDLGTPERLKEAELFLTKGKR